MRYARGSDADDWTTEAREWDIPLWFWEHFTVQGASSQNWEKGVFSGNGAAPQGYGSITLNAVHFLRSSLDVLLPLSAESSSESQYDPPKPPLPEAELQRWWEKRSPVRDALAQEDLWALAKTDFPTHTVSRDRIRTLTEGRRPGPKTDTRDSSA